ncbi:23S rRNA (pseudouridine(1915)-N(3))-methyltransferase RlmH [Sulfobacillus acidophilus]|uniref:Ribosomal RNA large subunit methyltransferase H n=1 Tax=Sulfobacillus acidophilus TaxID=53633 RepID=A0ABS3AWS1_9FIRM|nr:23S rRNA (pseudouridine(1915)-N(3))-methyltransferase RlmH [Sulfobacillus acidophilus]
MTILILKVGDAKDSLNQIAGDYLKRLKQPFRVNVNSIKSEKLLLLSKNFYRIVLDENGEQLTSKEFSKTLEKLTNRGEKIAFLIGGALGHNEEVLKSANKTIALSKMTLPHRLAFCLLAEQIYRAQEIAHNGPYHK